MGLLRAAALLLPILLLTQSASCLRRRLTSVSHRNLLWSSPNYTIYHRQEDLLREVEGIVQANQGFMKFEKLSAADGNYAAELKVVTVEPGGSSERQGDKIRMLLDFGEHGRELISSELGLLLLRTLADPQGAMTVWPDDPERGRRLQRLLAATHIKLLPMENEGGRRLVEAGRACERKNGRGVDPNRNWPIDWGRKEPDYDPNEEYPGTAPFSEPEVKLLKELATDYSPHVWLNIHSGMEAMFVPWDHKATVADGADDSLRILQIIQRDVMTGTGCVVGSGGKTVGYLAHGTATDFMYGVLRVPVSYTWEIYGDFKAHFDDCFRMFNPVDEAGVQAVLQRWLRAIFRLLELLPSHPALRDSPAWALAEAAGAAAAAGQQTDGQSATAAADGSGGATGGAGTGAGAASSTSAETAAAATTSAPTSASSSAAASAAAAQAGTAPATATTAEGPMPGAASAGTTDSRSAGGGAPAAAAATQPGPGAAGGSGGSSGGGGGAAGSEQAAAAEGESGTRVAVVASSLGFGGGSWGSGGGWALLAGAAAAAGLAAAGFVLYRHYYSRGSAGERGARGAAAAV